MKRKTFILWLLLSSLLVIVGTLVELYVKTEYLNFIELPFKWSDFFSIFINIIIGVISSLVSWYFLYYYLSPKISFGSDIAKSKVNHIKCGYNYRFKIANSGTRPIVDIELFPRIYLTGIGKNKKLNEIIPPIIGTRRIPILYPNKKSRFIAIQVYKTERFRKKFIPEDIRTKYEDGILTLEDVLSAGIKAKLVIVAFGYDYFSGSRKIFISPEYTINNIIETKINDIDLVEYKKRIFKDIWSLITGKYQKRI